MKTIRIGDVQNSLIRLMLWQVGREPITDRHLRSAKESFDNKCAYCGEEKTLDFDHAVPINKTALGQHRVGNLVPSCSDCNQKKGQRDFREYLREFPGGDIKIARILEYMERLKYVPLSDDKQVKALLEIARKEVADTADRYIAAVNELLASSPSIAPNKASKNIGESNRVSNNMGESSRSTNINGSTDTDQDLYKVIYEIKVRMNRSWPNLRRACLELMGVSVTHGTPKVGASSRVFARRASEATGLQYVNIIALLDRLSLGLDQER